ncbi:MAG: hypothetical protein H7A51_15800 [Akkermansiaceae bacterium]|nr:hypothetical protein [Akkermansiaceae bacterium]
MNTHDIEDYFASHRSILAVLLIVVGIVSVSGFFMGMRQSTRSSDDESLWRAAHAPAADEHATYPVAPLYKDIPTAEWKANKDWVNSLANLPTKEMDRSAREPMDEHAIDLILADRQSRRAYDGAPPTIPHSINYRDVQSCSACHSQDANVLIAGKRVPAMSHPYMANCTQCHAPASGMTFAVHSGTTGLVVENKFRGSKRYGNGQRAFPGAPPTLPHPVWMRQNCVSCHGPGMADAITTSHPQRQNCLQCHAPYEGYDNRERLGPLTPPVGR